MPRSRISQYAFSKKIPERVSRIKLMNKPSTVVIIPFMSVHTTPSKGRMPSTREITSIIESTLPPVNSCQLPVASCQSKPGFMLWNRASFSFLSLFAPELVSGAANEDVLERRLAHRERLDLSGESLDHFGDKAVRAFAFHAHLVLQNCGFHVEARPDPLCQQSRIMGRVEQHHVAADFAFQLRGRAQSYPVAFIHDGQPVTALRFFHEMRGDEHGNMLFVAQDRNS